MDGNEIGTPGTPILRNLHMLKKRVYMSGWFSEVP